MGGRKRERKNERKTRESGINVRQNMRKRHKRKWSKWEMRKEKEEGRKRK